MKKTIIFGISALLASAATADTTVQGLIRDAYTNEPLAGARVQAFSNKTITVMTDSTGFYSLNVPDYVKSLRVIRPGYNTVQLSLAGRDKDVDAYLYKSTFTESVGLASSSQSALTASISDLNADITVESQVASQLGGQIRCVNRGGVPGLGNFMLIHGINSLHVNTQPLVVLDGVILDMQYDRTTNHLGFYNDLLANVSVDDIEKVTVLRNGTAIYGAKGANGVILIDTKRSRSFDTRIDVNVSGSFEQLPNMPEMMNASEYRTYVSEMIGTTGLKASDFNFLREDPNYYYYKVLLVI